MADGIFKENLRIFLKSESPLELIWLFNKSFYKYLEQKGLDSKTGRGWYLEFVYGTSKTGF